MISELPAPCTSRPPPLRALPLITWIRRSVRRPPPLTSMARDMTSASSVAPSPPRPSMITSIPLLTLRGEPPRRKTTGSRYSRVEPSAARAARSSAVEPTARPPGAIGGSSGEGELGGGGRGGGETGGATGGSGLREAMQQPVQSQPIEATAAQLKDPLSSPQVCCRPQGRAQGPFPWPAATGTSARASSMRRCRLVAVRGTIEATAAAAAASRRCRLVSCERRRFVKT